MMTFKSLSSLVAPVTLAAMVGLGAAQAQAAPITEQAVYAYSAAMKQAANNKDVNGVSSLVDNDALISLSRNGKNSSLDKSAYLQLLQKSWSNSDDYAYDITISNVVTSGEQAKADVKTVETWLKDGKKVTLTTVSRATLRSNENNAVLLRAVAQVTIK